MAGLILFVAAAVLLFGRRFLAGDRKAGMHRSLVLMLAASQVALVTADHLLVVLVCWTLSNLVLVRLMIHKAEWKAARNSGWLALRTFAFGSLVLGAGFFLLADWAGTASIHGILEKSQPSNMAGLVGLTLIALAAITQSAAWPFHGWLISSLNSPTPVSALMHAGLVNGGGFLLARFAPLYAAAPVLLGAIFAAGLVAAIAGSFWKLLQTDIKRMLACSTMGQMGFMLMQCGMGLFAPAVSHLCWHGLFKAYLFLGAGSVIREKRQKEDYGPKSAAGLVTGLVAGIAGAASFAAVSGMGVHPEKTSIFIVALAFMVAAQLGFGLAGARVTLTKTVISIAGGVASGLLYGASVLLIEVLLSPLAAAQPQSMNTLYWFGLALTALIWTAFNVAWSPAVKSSSVWKRIYMAGLNASQPHPATVTVTRTTYRA
jgi:NAD(P)H-quinone oxidoreductase subunit 5